MRTSTFRPSALRVAVCLAVLGHAGMDALAAVPTWTLPNPPTSTVAQAAQQVGYTIEPGCGRQLEGLRGELVVNGSFDEEVGSAPSHNWTWSGYQPGTDLSAFPWWHSGYRVAAWEGLGEPGKFTVDARSTTAAFRGAHGALVVNDGQFPARLFQRGIRVHSNSVYALHAFIKSAVPGKLDVSAGLYAEDSGWRVLVETSVPVGPEWTQRAWKIENGSFDGDALLVISVPPGGTVFIDDVSLQGSNLLDGWRVDAVAAIKQVAPAVLRFPGTAVAATYNWRDGFGPLAQRKPGTNGFWSSYCDNSVGSAEIVDLCRLTGSEALFCANLDALTPEALSGWVAYCNASTNDPHGSLRAEHGRPNPLGVRLWEIDAGTSGDSSVSDRLTRVATAAQAVKAMDPATRVILTLPATEATNEVASLNALLSAAGRFADFISVRRPIQELGEPAALVEDFNARNGTTIRLCNTEYDLPGDAPSVTGAVSVTAADRTSWTASLAKAEARLDAHALGDHLPLVCLTGLANGWGRNVLECSADSAWLSPFGRITALLAGTGDATLTEMPETAAGLRAWAATSSASAPIQLIVLNRSDAPVRRAILPPSSLARARHLVTTTLDEDVSSPGAIRRDVRSEELVRGPFQFTAPARSISLLLLRD